MRVVDGICCSSAAHMVNEDGPGRSAGLVSALNHLGQGVGDLRLIERIPLLPRMEVEAHGLVGADLLEAVPYPPLHEDIDR